MHTTMRSCRTMSGRVRRPPTSTGIQLGAGGRAAGRHRTIRSLPDQRAYSSIEPSAGSTVAQLARGAPAATAPSHRACSSRCQRQGRPGGSGDELEGQVALSGHGDRRTQPRPRPGVVEIHGDATVAPSVPGAGGLGNDHATIVDLFASEDQGSGGNDRIWARSAHIVAA